MRSIFLILIVFGSICKVNSQVLAMTDESSFKERIYFGGGLDMAFDDSRGIIGLSPSIGYMLTKTTSLGVGITYQYYFDRYSRFSTDIYGYRFFLRQNLIAQLFAYAEYENLSYENNLTIDNKDRTWQDAIYLGGGWYQPISDRVGFLAIGLYNVKNRNYQGSPWSFRAGFTFSPF